MFFYLGKRHFVIRFRKLNIIDYRLISWTDYGVGFMLRFTVLFFQLIVYSQKSVVKADDETRESNGQRIQENKGGKLLQFKKHPKKP